MKSERLPVRLDPWRSARKQERFRGSLPLATMSRLGELLHGHHGEVRLRLECGVDLTGIHYWRGELDTELELLCQRCLTPFVWPLQLQFHLALVDSERAVAALDPSYEPLLVTDGLITVADVIEEELLLALPLIALHSESDCPQQRS
ncbi:DNA-binding protein [Ectothiorhodospiraceae bacterium BW-2]|nr:DNA-binding protein [Ectothiorhodospiraceae bacterium BW-2]